VIKIRKITSLFILIFIFGCSESDGLGDASRLESKFTFIHCTDDEKDMDFWRVKDAWNIMYFKIEEYGLPEESYDEKTKSIYMPMPDWEWVGGNMSWHELEIRFFVYSHFNGKKKESFGVETQSISINRSDLTAQRRIEWKDYLNPYFRNAGEVSWWSYTCNIMSEEEVEELEKHISNTHQALQKEDTQRKKYEQEKKKKDLENRKI
tara:strand:+ start:790 stop:1410 length:621 start_codon:yes stop_codon:yes gene_type:complete